MQEDLFLLDLLCPFSFDRQLSLLSRPSCQLFFGTAFGASRGESKPAPRKLTFSLAWRLLSLNSSYVVSFNLSLQSPLFLRPSKRVKRPYAYRGGLPPPSPMTSHDSTAPSIFPSFFRVTLFFDKFRTPGEEVFDVNDPPSLFRDPPVSIFSLRSFFFVFKASKGDNGNFAFSLDVSYIRVPLTSINFLPCSTSPHPMCWRPTSLSDYSSVTSSLMVFFRGPKKRRP